MRVFIRNSTWLLGFDCYPPASEHLMNTPYSLGDRMLLFSVSTT